MSRSGTDRDIVLSTRVRLARNVEGWKFQSKMSSSERKALNDVISREMESNPFFSDFSCFNIDDIDEIDRIVLKERKLISERFYRGGSGLVAMDRSQKTSLVTGDLDHIRISSIDEGLAVDEVLSRVQAVVTQLAGLFHFAETSERGFLTASISDAGTALKGSVYLHLPVLNETDRMDQLIIGTIETSLEVTGFTGGGPRSLGGLYIVSNRSGMAGSESSLSSLLADLVKRFAERERAAREELLKGLHPILEDRIFRAFGLLKYCRQISEQEALSALSLVRLGVAVHLIDELSLEDFSQVFLSIGNGYLRSFAYERNPDENDIMRLRALTIRKGLKINL